MRSVDFHSSRLTRIYLNLDHLSHNMNLLQRQVGERKLWPCIKANAYGHGADIIARHLIRLGYDTLGVADVGEAAELIDSGIDATFIVLSAMLPEHSEALIAYNCEPVVCTREMVDALSSDAQKMGKYAAIHVKVDTGMGRIGIRPDEVPTFLEYCCACSGIHVRGLMSHFSRADESDKTFSHRQIEAFKQAIEVVRKYGIEVHHMANSAGIIDLPDSCFDAARPGIAVYGLHPSREMVNPLVNELKPILEWKSRITFLKEVPEGTGLSYGHIFITRSSSLIATVPVGYGDGLNRNLSGEMDFLVCGTRCPQVGRITMDMSLVDVTALRGRVKLGDEVVIIGSQGRELVSADELADKLGTINYEIVTCISHRVPRFIEGDTVASLDRKS